MFPFTAHSCFWLLIGQVKVLLSNMLVTHLMESLVSKDKKGTESGNSSNLQGEGHVTDRRFMSSADKELLR